MSNIISEEIKRSIVNDYCSHPQSISAIADKYGYCKPTISKILSQYGVKVYTQQQIYSYGTNEDIFNIIDNEEKDIIHATTYGVGELISDAVSRGIIEFYIGLGGSATNDCGIGMLKALGYRFTDGDGHDADLGEVERIDMQDVMPELKQCSFKVLSDVNNPLYGPNGASAVFAPQKGATPEEVVLMDTWMRRFGIMIENLKFKNL